MLQEAVSAWGTCLVSAPNEGCAIEYSGVPVTLEGGRWWACAWHVTTRRRSVCDGVLDCAEEDWVCRGCP